MTENNFQFNISTKILDYLINALKGKDIDTKKLSDFISDKHGSQKKIANLLKEKYSKTVTGRKLFPLG